MELLEAVSGLHEFPKSSLLELFEVLHYNPMAIALAAVTIKICSSQLPVLEVMFSSLLQSLSNNLDPIQGSLDLYFEAVVSDSHLRHTFDFLGSCDLTYPLLVSAVPDHLSIGLYGICNEALAPPPLDPIIDKLKLSAATNSFWDRLKSIVPFWQSTRMPSEDDIATALAASRDEISFLRESPILSFQQSCHSDLECITVHPLAVTQLSKLFLEHTVAKFDQDHVSKESREFDQNGWFKKYRTFNVEKSLAKFHRMLPGVSSPGVLTEAQFNAIPPNCTQGQGHSLPSNLTYTQYLHLVSHYHRVVSSLVTTARSVRGVFTPILLKRYIIPHLEIIKTFPLLSQADRLSIDISLVGIMSAASPEDCSTWIADYDDLIAQQIALLGAKSVSVAHSLVDLGDLHLSVNNASSGKECLLSALEIYQKHFGDLQKEDLSLDMGRALSSLGLACGQLGEKELSKSYYEQALATVQAIPANGKVSLKQQRLVASLLVDVTHAYLCLGELAVARKYCELATVMLQSVYPQGHTETVRLFNISSIVSALLGDREGSMKYHNEASKLKSKFK